MGVYRTRQLPPLVPAPRSVCLRLTPFPCQHTPPFTSLNLHPGSCRPLGGGLSVVGTSTSTCPCLALLAVFSESSHCLVLGLFVGGFTKMRDSRAPPLPGGHVPNSSLPLLLVHAGDVQANRLPPPPLPPSPYPPCCCDPIHVGRRSVGSSARRRCKGCMELSC